MAEGEKQFGLFGYPTPEEVRMQIGRAGLAEDIQMAQLPRGSMGKVLGATSGRMLSNGIADITGFVDPRIQRAERVKVAQQRVQQIAKQKGIDFASNPKGYLSTAAQVFADMGEQELAFNLVNQISELEKSSSEVYKNQAAGDKDYMLADAKGREVSAKLMDVLSKVDTRKQQLIIDRLKADAYMKIAGTQGAQGSASKQKMDRYFAALDVVKEATLNKQKPPAWALYEVEQLGTVLNSNEVMGKYMDEILRGGAPAAGGADAFDQEEAGDGWGTVD